MPRASASGVDDERGPDLSHARRSGDVGDTASREARQLRDPGGLQNSRRRIGDRSEHIGIETSPVGNQDFERRDGWVDRPPSLFDRQAMPMGRMLQDMPGTQEFELFE